MIQSTRRAAGRVALVLALELVAAGWWRWPTTAAPIQMPFDYGTGHATVVSENWRIHGAFRRHFLPVMSIEPAMPEWPYRTELAQEYTSVPPLAFILHYAATRLVPFVEPVLVGKLLAQLLIAASVLGASVFFTEAFGALPTLAGLTFAIWGVPFLLWFANGYFAVNVGLAAQLVLVAWCGAVAHRCLGSESDVAVSRPHVQAAVGGALAFAGGFADYMPLIGNAIAFAGLLAIALARWRAAPAARRLALASAAGVAVGSGFAGVLTLALYSAELGGQTYLAAVARRTAERSGHAPFALHVDVVRRQMLTAWPVAVLVPLLAMVAAFVLWAARTMTLRRDNAADASIALFTLAVAAGPSLFFHYTAVNYVSIHWWFAGTWILAWTVGVCALVSAARRRRVLQWAALAIVAAFVILDVRFMAAQPTTDPARADVVEFYRSLGRDLPHDHMPIAVTDITLDRPSLFEDFPYASAYLRRPLLLRESDGTLRLPAVTEPWEGKMVRFGGERVDELLYRRGGDVYVAYDPAARSCFGVDMPLGAWARGVPVAVCRVSAATLAQHPEAILGPLRPGYPCTAPPPPPTDVHVVANRHQTVVISWTGSAYRRAAHILEVGRSAGRSDALTADLGRATTYTARQVPPGLYYVRVRSRSAACGTSAASNELAIRVE